MAKPLALGVLVSGSGSNLQAILDATAARTAPAEVRVVLCNRPGARAIERARQHQVTVEIADHRSFESRESFDRHLIERLQAHNVELVCLAGFDRLISSSFVDAFRNRILNVHPALLPAFKGLHAQRQALEHGAKVTGCTVHFVDEQIDHGPIILQATVPIFDNDDEATLSARILAQEHRIYVEAINLYAEHRLRIEGRRVRVLAETPPNEVRDPSGAG